MLFQVCFTDASKDIGSVGDWPTNTISLEADDHIELSGSNQYVSP